MLQNATQALLRPLIKLLLSNGVSFGEFSEWARDSFVEVAERDFALEGKVQTSTRISVLTGIFRRDVARIRKQAAKPIEKTKTSNRLVRIIAAWRRVSEYLDETGEPKTIPVEGEAPSLEMLAKRYGGDVSYQAILKEMERLQIVETTDDGRLVLKALAYVPSKDLNRQFELMGRACEDLLSTINHNIENPDNSRIQMSVAYEGVPPETVNRFKQMSERKAMALLRKFDAWLADNLEEYSDELTSDEDREEQYRVGLGLYYFQERQ